MESSIIEEIQLNGRSFVTIDHDSKGRLVVTTHKDTEVDIRGKVLVIKDPLSRGVTTASSTPPDLSFLGKNMRSLAQSFINAGNHVHVSRNAYGSSVMFSDSPITMEPTENVKKEDCTTRHIMPCDYAHIQRVTSIGVIETTFRIPLEKTRQCDVSLRGTGSLWFTVKQSFMRLNVQLNGTGMIEIPATTIGTLHATLQGTGAIRLQYTTTIDNAAITCAGTGTIALGDACIDTASVKLAGTGTVKRFSVMSDATLHLGGTGLIQCNATRTAKIQQQKAGVGRICVTRETKK